MEKKDSLTIDFKKLFSGWKKREQENQVSAVPEQKSKEENREKEGVHAKPEEKLFTFDTEKSIAFFKKYGFLFLLLIPLVISFQVRTIGMDLPITDRWAENSVNQFFRNQITSQIEQRYPNLPAQTKEPLIAQELEKLIQENQAMYQEQIQQVSQQFKQQFQDVDGETYLGDIDTYHYYRLAKNILEHGHNGNIIRVPCSDFNKESCLWDSFTLAPVGEPAEKGSRQNLLPPLVVFTYKVMNLFGTTSLRMAFSYVPVLISMLGVIPAFFLARRIGGNLGGFFAAILIAVHPNFLVRTMGGSSDTDAFNVFFPLMIFWLFLEGFETENQKKAMLLTAAAGVLTGMYAYAWGGWWYIFDFVLFSIIGYFLYKVAFTVYTRKPLMEYLKSKEVRNDGLMFFIYFIISTLSVIGIWSMNIKFRSAVQIFASAFRTPVEMFFSFKEAAKETLWPNVYTTVAELNEIGISSAINSLSGKLLFGLSLLGILFTMLPKNKKSIFPAVIAAGWYLLLVYFFIDMQSKLLFCVLLLIPFLFSFGWSLYFRERVDVKMAIVLIVWYTGMVFASTKGIRFTMLLVPPYSLGLGIFIGYLFIVGMQALEQSLHIMVKYGKPIVAVLLCLLLLSPVKGAYRAGEGSVPLINDAWWFALTKIKEQTRPDAIITSWWDYGHWFKAVADRAVTFDGANQNNPQAHWAGKLFLTWDEREALGILRMLDCGGDSRLEGTVGGVYHYRGGVVYYPVDLIDEVLKDFPKSIDLLNKILVLNKENAKAALLQYLPEEAAENVLRYTHCRPPQAMVITSEDMVGKSGVWAHFGNWDFRKAKTWVFMRKNPNSEEALQFFQQEFNMSQEEARRWYEEARTIRSEDEANRWISPWPGYGGMSPCNQVSNTTITCPVQINEQGQATLSIDLEAGEATFQGNDGKLIYPKYFAYLSKDGFTVKEGSGNTIDIGYALVPADGTFQLLRTDPKLTGSLFTKLFYLKEGGKYFKQFDIQRDITGLEIIVWEVDWDRFLEDSGDQ